MADKEGPASRVSERLSWMTGRLCSVQVTYGDAGERFDGRYVDVVPLGREYFFVFEVADQVRLIRTSSVVEILVPGKPHDDA